MTVTVDPYEVRELVLENFREYGAKPDDLEHLSETLLIQGGRYFGRSYRTEELMAMWMPEVGVLQFYSADGTMLRTVNLFTERSPLRQAA
ncbi:MAG TPA: hypothetical protein VFE24_16745 [Pirellulales bacterium]|jgi:hypothetical protein|nr:hypothetical protein [Pirellulales bacterium]